MMNFMQKDTISKESNEQELCVAIRSNNELILSSLYRNNYFKVERYVIENNGSITEAKDVFQEAFVAVWRNIQMHKFSPLSENDFTAYLYQVSKYKWIDTLRSQQRKVLFIQTDVDGMEDVLLNEHDNKYVSLVRKHFANLGQTCREILVLFYFQNQSLQKIALARKWTEATAKNNKYRCIQQLRSLVKTDSI